MKRLHDFISKHSVNPPLSKLNEIIQADLLEGEKLCHLSVTTNKATALVQGVVGGLGSLSVLIDIVGDIAVGTIAERGKRLFIVALTDQRLIL